jgi:PAS domain S-box-containing protein
MPRRILAGFLLGLFVLVSAAGLLARSITTLQAERQPAKHARNELEVLVSFLATAEDAETGQRGYLLTGDSTYLAPYETARRTIDSQVATLDSLTAQDPTEHAAVVALRTHVTAKMAELAETIQERAASPQAARARVLEGAGQRDMTAIRKLIGALRQEERQRLDAHLVAYTSGVRALLINLAVAITLQFLLLGILFLFIRRDQAFRTGANARLTHEREFLRALLENLSEGVIATDVDGLPTMSSRVFRDLFGVDVIPETTGEWADIQSRIRDIDVPEITLSASAMPLRRAAGGEHVVNAAFAFAPPGTKVGERPGSGTRYIVANGQPILESSGRQVGAVVAFRDMTQEYLANAAMQASEERFRRLSDAATDGVIVSRDGIILEVNAAWCRMCGADESVLIGTPVINAVAPSDRDAVARMVRENRTVTYSLTCLRADGTTFDGQVTARPIIYRGETARISVVRDVTEWTRVNRLKSEFVSTVSHELRTPLTSIHGAIKLVASGAVAPLPAKVQQLLSIAHTNCERLVRLVNDMLDLDKIEAGKLEMRTTALAPADVVRPALDGIRAMAEEYRMRLDDRIDTERPFKGDRDRIIQVLTNLLSNAVKFAAPGTMVSISATHAVGPRDRIRFAVTNEGPGIQPSDVALLFTRFQQLDGSDARHRGGTGLGLAISKAIIEEHGGTIGVDSQPGATTTFWFELPAARITASRRIVVPAQEIP